MEQISVSRKAKKMGRGSAAKLASWKSAVWGLCHGFAFEVCITGELKAASDEPPLPGQKRSPNPHPDIPHRELSFFTLYITGRFLRRCKHIEKWTDDLHGSGVTISRGQRVYALYCYVWRLQGRF